MKEVLLGNEYRSIDNRSPLLKKKESLGFK